MPAYVMLYNRREDHGWLVDWAAAAQQVGQGNYTWHLSTPVWGKQIRHISAN